MLVCAIAAASLGGGGSLTAAAAAQADTTASFGWSPATPVSGQTVTFSSTSTAATGRSIRFYAWDVENDGKFDDGTTASATHTFDAPGSYTIKLVVVDDHGGWSLATRTVTVANAPPVASFSVSPAAPLSAVPVTFTSTSSDVDGHVVSQSWDLDGDGRFGDASGPSATTTFATPGAHTVRLQVVDDKGATAVASRTVVVGNRQPVPSFDFTPAAPVAGQAVTFSSTSHDPDGRVVSEAWDLNGDGKFDDASGAAASHVFGQPGTHFVALRVTDDQGAAAVTQRSVTVAAPAPSSSTPASGGEQQGEPRVGFDTGSPTPAVPTAPGLARLVPFPVVRVRGSAGRLSTRVTVFTVTAPAGARITVACRGRSCRRHAIAKVARGGGNPPLVHIRALERALAPGTRIEVRVTAPGLVGKYTRLVVRRHAAPRRLDSCLLPGSDRPTACPADS